MKPTANDKIRLAGLTRRLLIAGGILIISLLTASTVTYIGAGTLFEYCTAMTLSGTLLGYVRTAAVLLCAGALAAEYTVRSKQNESGE